MKNILIIGNQGYLGSCLSDYLKEKTKHRITGTDIGFFKHGVIYKNNRINQLNIDARVINCKDIEKYDCVILLAGISNDPVSKLPIETIYHPTRDYALKIAECCSKLGIKFIFPSSCSVFGVGSGFLTEEGPVNPVTPYSKNKLEIEEGLKELGSESFSPIALRFATIFGPSPRMRFDLVINMLCGMAVAEKKILLNSDGQAWRPHLHIADACEAIRCSIEWDNKGTGFNVFNVGRNENNLRILDVAHLVAKESGISKIEFLGAEVQDSTGLIMDRKISGGVDKRSYQVVFDRVNKFLPGFHARWSVHEGIRELLAFLEKFKLNIIKFYQRDFYRLQQIEYLIETNQLDENLKWIR
jgi:nucleoside-diphosphate-sugar epimerase